jgi:DNA end-binding protein Ku
VLVPAKKAEKGYVLLREALQQTGRIGIARVVIRTRESLCAVMPQDDALLLLMMRYPQELVDIGEYNIPEGSQGDYRISAKELEFSKQLIETMSTKWKPDDYQDVFRERLHKVIKQRMEAHGVVRREEEEHEPGEGAATNVVDFMSLLQQSIDRNKRTPAKKAAGSPAKSPARKTAARKSKTATKKAPAKTARRKSA